jgi:site-specific recombinase XerD
MAMDPAARTTADEIDVVDEPAAGATPRVRGPKQARPASAAKATSNPTVARPQATTADGRGTTAGSLPASRTDAATAAPGAARRSTTSTPHSSPGPAEKRRDAGKSAFDQLRELFLASLSAKSPRTYTTYQTGLGRFREYLEARGQLQTWTPNRLTASTLEEFYGWLVRRHGSAHRATTATYSSALRAFVRFLARRGLLPRDVTYEQMRENVQAVMGRATYKTPRVDRRLPLLVTQVLSMPLPPPADRKGEKRLELLRDRALLLTLFCTGMRREEVSRLDRYDLEDGWADRALITGKGEKERVVFFDDPTRAAIRAYLEARSDALAPVFIRHDNHRGDAPGHGGHGWRLSPQSVWGVVKRYAREVGVPATTHHFRHSKASVLLNRGADLSEVQDILGHASPDTTKRIYAHYQSQHLRDVFDQYSASAEELVAELPASSKTSFARELDTTK